MIIFIKCFARVLLPPNAESMRSDCDGLNMAVTLGKTAGVSILLHNINPNQ